MWNKLLLALKSRTIWTAVVGLLVNVVPAVKVLVPAEWLPLVDGLVFLLVAHFHLNPSQNYK